MVLFALGQSGHGPRIRNGQPAVGANPDSAGPDCCKETGALTFATAPSGSLHSSFGGYECTNVPGRNGSVSRAEQLMQRHTPFDFGRAALGSVGTPWAVGTPNQAVEATGHPLRSVSLPTPLHLRRPVRALTATCASPHRCAKVVCKPSDPRTIPGSATVPAYPRHVLLTRRQAHPSATALEHATRPMTAVLPADRHPREAADLVRPAARETRNQSWERIPIPPVTFSVKAGAILSMEVARDRDRSTLR